MVDCKGPDFTQMTRSSAIINCLILYPIWSMARQKFYERYIFLFLHNLSSYEGYPISKSKIFPANTILKKSWVDVLIYSFRSLSEMIFIFCFSKHSSSLSEMIFIFCFSKHSSSLSEMIFIFCFSKHSSCT